MRAVILGEYYYPKNGSRWILRGDKTEFERGDTIIIQDDRVKLAVGGYPMPDSELVYLLDDDRRILTYLRHNVSDAIEPFIYGANPVPTFEAGMFALSVIIGNTAGSITGKFKYLDGDLRAETGEIRVLEEVSVLLATISTPGFHADPEPVSSGPSPEPLTGQPTFPPAGHVALRCYIVNTGTFPRLYCEDGTHWIRAV